MRTVLLLTVLPLSLFANGSDNIRSIDSVKQWKIDDRLVHVKGTINRLDDKTGFYLSDDTGEIHVFCDTSDLHFKTGSYVEVKGTIDREHTLKAITIVTSKTPFHN